MNQRFCLLVTLLGLAVLIGPRSARADFVTPIFYDGFEDDTANVLDTSLINWNVVSGSVDILSAGNVCNTAGGSSSCIDLDGTGALAGTIETKLAFALDPGTYRLSFDLAGANRQWSGSESNTVMVSLGSYFSEAFTMLQYDPFQTFTRDIIVDAVGSAPIGFSHQGADWIGLLLDNVSLAHVTFDDSVVVIPTPEPGSWELITSLLGLAVWRFGRRNRG